MNQTVLAALLAAASALLGVLLSNWFNKRGRESQMAFDAEQKRLERLTKLRTDVYIEAAAQMVRMNAFLGSIANLPLANLSERTEYPDFAAAIAKLSVVAESETAYQVNELQALVSKAYMRASIAAWPVNRCSDGMKRANSRHEEAFANAQQVHNLMMEAVRSGNKDINLSMLRDEHSMYMKRMEEASAERQKYDDQHQSELERFHAVLLPLLKAIREPMITTMSRIRGDLGLTTATGKLKDQMERMGKEADAELATTMQAIEALRRA